MYVKCPELASPQKQEAEECLPGAGGDRGVGVTINKYTVSSEVMKMSGMRMR